MSTHSTTRFLSARSVAERWECSIDVARARLRSAGLARYDFGTRSHRWLIDDVVALEEGRKVGTTRPGGSDRLRRRHGPRGPRPVLA